MKSDHEVQTGPRGHRDQIESPGETGRPRVAVMDWRVWHDQYDLPDSWMARRLKAVQTQIRAALDAGESGPLRVISLCAGQGRDLLEVLAEHPRRDDVQARLVEL